MPTGLSRKIRYIPKRRLFVVRTRQPGQTAKLSTVGHGPWVDVLVKPTRKHSLAPVSAVRTGKRIVQEKNIARKAAGQKPIDLTDWGSNRKMRAVRIHSTPNRVFLEVEPRKMSEYLASREESGRTQYGQWRGRVRSDLHGKSNLLKSQVQLLASGTILMIGDKYIVLPKRPEKAALYPGQYHLFAGYGEAPAKDFRNKRLPQPHQTTRRELEEEVGIKKGFEFVGRDWKKAKGRPPALAVIQNLERELPYPDVFYLGRVRTRDPDACLQEHFETTPDGKIVPKKGVDKWEMGDGIVIPLSSQSIAGFIHSHSGQITPMALVALKALEQSLKERRR